MYHIIFHIRSARVLYTQRAQGEIAMPAGYGGGHINQWSQWKYALILIAQSIAPSMKKIVDWKFCGATYWLIVGFWGWPPSNHSLWGQTNAVFQRISFFSHRLRTREVGYCIDAEGITKSYAEWIKKSTKWKFHVEESNAEKKKIAGYSVFLLLRQFIFHFVSSPAFAIDMTFGLPFDLLVTHTTHASHSIHQICWIWFDQRSLENCSSPEWYRKC